MAPPTYAPVTTTILNLLAASVGHDGLATDRATLDICSLDALGRDGHRPEVVVRPSTAAQVAAVARLCTQQRIPLVARGAGTGYTGGAVPILGGVVLSLERFNRILEIDVESLFAVVEPYVINGDLQAAVDARGLFYPPDPASLAQSTLGGNVAENAGGPRAFKYGTTKRYVLGLEAVLPTGEIVQTGGRTVKNVVGYDLTSLLVGSEGTLAIITKIIVRLVAKPPATRTLRATFATVGQAAAAVTAMIARGIEPATLELVDRESLDAVERMHGQSLAPRETNAMLLVEVDGVASSLREQLAMVGDACREAGALDLLQAETARERDELWRARRDLSVSLRGVASLKLNHDVVVPKGRVPELFDAVDDIRKAHAVRVACFGHAGDGNIHVNLLVDAANADEVRRAHQAEQQLFERVVALGGALSGEHGIGFTKIPFVHLQLSAEEIALARRVKAAFDPAGILNPGKMFPES